MTVFVPNTESFISVPPNHSTSWWFSDQLDLDDSYPPPHHIPESTMSRMAPEPPPYTEVAQNGHVSLMHGQSPVKPVDSSQEGDNADSSNIMDSNSLTANNVSVLEASQNNEDANDNSCMDSSPNASPDESQSPFHPTRQSTPILGRRLQLPPLRRSSAVDRSETPTVDGNRQQRHSLPNVQLSLHSSLPPRLRPISTPFLQQDNGMHTTDESTNTAENIGPFPIRPGRLPPVLPAMNREDHQRRVSVGSDGPNQLPRRRKKKRKRTNTWHGERLGTEMIHTIQEVNTLGVVTE